MSWRAVAAFVVSLAVAGCVNQIDPSKVAVALVSATAVEDRCMGSASFGVDDICHMITVNLTNSAGIEIPISNFDWQGRTSTGSDKDADWVDGPSKVGSGSQVETTVLFTTPNGVWMELIRYLPMKGSPIEIAIDPYELPS